MAVMIALVIAVAPFAAADWSNVSNSVAADNFEPETQSRRRAPSCQAYCTNTFGGHYSGYVMGHAPVCGGDCTKCTSGDKCGPLASKFSDGGHKCFTGSKQCCCHQVGSNDSNSVAADNFEPETQSRRRAPSCNDYCNSVGIRYGYVRGTAPWCGASPSSCCPHDYPGPQASKFSDGGHKCMSGSKQCCCGTPAGQSNCPPPGPGKLSCAIIKGACDIITGKIARGMACAELDVDGAAICEAVGLGPADPAADVCAVVVATSIQAACKKLVKEGAKFTNNECKKAAGCATVDVIVPVGNASVVVPVVV